MVDGVKRDAKRRGMTVQGWMDGAVVNELTRRKRDDEILEERRKRE